MLKITAAAAAAFIPIIVLIAAAGGLTAGNHCAGPADTDHTSPRANKYCWNIAHWVTANAQTQEFECPIVPVHEPNRVWCGTRTVE